LQAGGLHVGEALYGVGVHAAEGAVSAGDGEGDAVGFGAGVVLDREELGDVDAEG
jgi:hypothetical protein